jgi:DNA-binding CsgD family transcriptional regulator
MASNRAQEYMNKFHARKLAKGQLKSLQYYMFENLEYIETNFRGELRVQLFRDGAEEYTYWLTREEREPIIIRMLTAGMKQTLIAKILKISSGTVNKDVRMLRLYTDKLNHITHLRPLKPARTADADDAFLKRMKREGRRSYGEPAAVIVLH